LTDQVNEKKLGHLKIKLDFSGLTCFRKDEVPYDILGCEKTEPRNSKRNKGSARKQQWKSARTNQDKMKVFISFRYYSRHLRAEGEYQATDAYFSIII